ncbi:NrsF family protein [Luteibacter sp.]|uniref:NrsF family protein n=1 Tax=Luteibacter sp. TaxID=1886636 RepID=UPI003F7D1A0B
MKTDDFIDFLAREPSPPPGRQIARRRFSLGILAGMGTSSLLMAALLGLRPDLAQVIHDPMFWVRMAFPIAIGVAALVVTVRLSRPGVRVGAGGWASVALPVIVAWALAAIVLAGAPEGQRGALMLGHTWKVCSTLIALLSLPSIVAVFWAVRGMAPVRLRLAGAAAGLLAGAMAATSYCLHCPEMAPPFWALWYLLGMVVAGALGALAGPRWLRW